MNQYLDLLETLNNAWNTIRVAHPDIPESIVVVATGGRRATSHYGWFMDEQWIETEPTNRQRMKGDKSYHEITLVAEQLHRGGAAVFTTLLHEGVHGLAKARGIKECSGARHNKRFASLAREVGLIPPAKPDKKLGFSRCDLDPDTYAQFATDIAVVEKALDICRVVKVGKPKQEPKKAKCVCRELLVSKKFLDAGNLICGNCMEKFVYPMKEAS